MSANRVFMASSIIVGALLLGTTANAEPAQSCEEAGGFTQPVAEIWAALGAGLSPFQNPPGFDGAWLKTDTEMIWVIQDGEQVIETRGEEVGLEVFKLVTADKFVGGSLWGYGDKLLGVYYSPSEIVHLVTLQTSGGSCFLFIEAGFDGDPYAPLVEGTLAAASEQTPPAAQAAVLPATSTCTVTTELQVCAVGEHLFCDALGTEVAFNKMASIVFVSYGAYETQTTAKMNVVWLKCYINGDPFDNTETNSNDALDDFKLKETHQPGGEATIMHLFTDRGINGGLAECPGQWGLGDYNKNSATASNTENNIFLHESGHNFRAEHETSAGGACGYGDPQADQLVTGDYSIMYAGVGDALKERIFTDGGTTNDLFSRNNVCVINREVLEKENLNTLTLVVPGCPVPIL